VRRTRFLPPAVAIALALAAPTSALAQGNSATNPLSGFPAPPTVATTSQTQAVVTNSSTGSSGGSSLSGSSAIGIAVGALVILGGISFFIWYDARRRAPTKAAGAAGAAAGRGRSGSKPASKPRKLSPAERRRRKRGRARS
jgi:hypothetical protein